MDKEYLKQLAEEAEELDPENEALWQENFDKRFAELSKDLNATMEYLSSCSEIELDWMSEVFEKLSEYFRSPELIACVEQIIKKFDNLELKMQLERELDYMKLYI